MATATLADVAGVVVLLTYYLVACAVVPAALRAWTSTPAEVVRKIQHLAYAMSVFPLLTLFSAWYTAVAASFLLLATAYPILFVLERWPRYREVFVDRAAGGGELRLQLLYLQLSFVVLIVVYWGVLGDGWRYVVAVAITAWGFGDAAAALVGKAIGRRRVPLPLADGAKTFEGTAAMLVASALAVFLTLLLYAGRPAPVSLLAAVVVAPVCAMVELVSSRGIDTFTVPFAAAAIAFPLLHALALAGWA